MGAWLSYGLGTLNKDLPDFVVLPSATWSGKVNVQALYSRLWGKRLPTLETSRHQFSTGWRSGAIPFQPVGDRLNDPATHA